MENLASCSAIYPIVLIGKGGLSIGKFATGFIKIYQIHRFYIFYFLALKKYSFFSNHATR
jgi:hypothetical protein